MSVERSKPGLIPPIRLRVGIATAYLLVMVPLTLGIIGYLYVSNARLILSTAEEEMYRATQAIIRDVQGLIQPVVHLVATTAEVVRHDLGNLRTIDGMAYFHRQVESLPQVYGMYAGFERDGNFYQVTRVPPGLRTLGPNGRPVPDGTHAVLRMLEGAPGRRADSFFLFRRWGETLAVDRGKATYDPRRRGWYSSALASGDTVISQPYTFASSGLIGVTVSHPVMTETGRRIGVVGADITLDTLSGFLARAQIGDHGRVFILDARGTLIGHPDPAQVVVRDGQAGRRDSGASEVGDPVVADALRRHAATGEATFEAPLGPEGKLYMASILPFENGFGQVWSVGVVVERSELLGPLAANSLRILAAGVVAMILAILAIAALTRPLTRPLQKVVEETEKIRRFDLSGDFSVRSNFIEIQQLTEAVRTTKRSLRSFSAYVPTDLVRQIVAEGNASAGTRRQPVTVMFTDIAGFTGISEGLSAEVLVESLNAYFQALSRCIHDTDGVVDKYIGDAVMALWNAPRRDPGHVANACRAALACRDAGVALAEAWEASGRPGFRTRFGLHTGDAVVGNVGGEDRIQYSAFGERVNLASRLEGLNKVYGTDILVTEDVVRGAGGDFVFRPLDTVVVMGGSRPARIFELVGLAGMVDEVTRVRLDHWQRCLTVYATRVWILAADAFARYLAEYPGDRPAAVLLKRCEGFMTEPPPAGWNGADRKLSK